MSDMTAQIESHIRSFVNELNILVRAAAIDAVRGALGGGSAPAPAKRGPGRPRKIATAAPAAPRTATPPRPPRPTSTPRTKAGGKRPPALLAKTIEALLGHIRSHPGERIEQIGKHLKLKTKELALPVQKLLAEKKISKKGVKRSTQYFPTSG